MAQLSRRPDKISEPRRPPQTLSGNAMEHPVPQYQGNYLPGELSKVCIFQHCRMRELYFGPGSHRSRRKEIGRSEKTTSNSDQIMRALLLQCSEWPSLLDDWNFSLSLQIVLYHTSTRRNFLSAVAEEDHNAAWFSWMHGGRASALM